MVFRNIRNRLLALMASGIPAASRAGLLLAASMLPALSHAQTSGVSVPLMLAPDSERQGFVRIINGTDSNGSVRITAVDDAGNAASPFSIELPAGASVHFNSDDLAVVDAWEHRAVAAASAGAREVAESAGEKEKAKSIDEQLWDAVAAQDRALAAKLLRQGADGGAQVHRGGVHIESFSITIDSSKENTSSLGYTYRPDTPLKKAAKDGSSAMVRLLLTAGADDADDAAFQHAVRSGQVDVVKDFLIARSDDPGGWEGRVVCGEACRYQYQGELGEKLRGHLLKSANAEAFSLFRQVGLAIDDLSSDQASALLGAAIVQNDAEVALMALAAGADPNLRIDARGVPKQRDDISENWPALGAAVSKEMPPRVVTALLEAGADVDATVTGGLSKVQGFTALHIAAATGSDDVVAILIERQAAIDPVSGGNDVWSSNKVTPLMLAANKGHAAVIRALIGAGADVKLNVSGLTALKVAKNKDIERLLKDARKRRD